MALLSVAHGENAPDAPARQLMAQLVGGYRFSQMVHVAAKLGIADHLKDGPQTVAELAKRTKTNPDALYRLMRTLSGTGVFAEEDQMRFRLTPAAELLLAGAPGSMRAEALVSGEDFMWKSWGGLLHSVQTGETAFNHLFGQGTWEWFKAHPREARLFDGLQAEGTRRATDSIVGSYDFSGAKHVIDIAGGNGELLSAILAKNPQARGTLFELDHVVAAAKANPLPALASRCTFVGGDFFKSIPSGGDVYLLKYIIHDWDDARSLEILKNVRRAIPAGGKLLLIEELICSRNEACRAKVGDITMLVRTGGKNRTEAEYRKLLGEAGFDVARVLPAQGDLAILEATPRKVIPKVWDEAALAEWATPLAALQVRPSHMSAEKYYALPVDNLKTYPVYLPDQEPPGYWEMLNRVGPQPLIEPEKLKTDADWVEAGRIAFEQLDHIHLRTRDPQLIAAVRRGESFIVGPGGRAMNLRWVPTKDGVALSFPNCANCHTAVLPNGTVVPGAPTFAFPPKRTGPPGRNLVGEVQYATGFANGGAPIRMRTESVGMNVYRASATPWVKDDIHTQMKSLTRADVDAWIAAGLRGGAVPRWNGSLYYPAKTPDLIGVKDRKYIDHTGTHSNRGVGDLMRYAALVTTAESTSFGGHNVLGPESETAPVRLSDEVLYALGVYIESLQPPSNPHPFDAKAAAGEKVFRREGCAGCHTPPLYTNNKLTLARGFTLPKSLPKTLDVLPVSVGTDPGLALQTRKGTGFYKVPSLRGVWYRGHFLHDGSVGSLEEMFDPDRLRESHVPGGFVPPGVKSRAIPGHEFGLKLAAEERAQLIAFLRTL